MNNQQNDDMDRQTLNVAFATQKGGSGKTAITVLVAGYLHYLSLIHISEPTRPY